MRLSLAAGLLLALSALAGTARADVVELKDGRRIEGIFRGASPAIVALQVGGQTMTFSFDEVRALYFGDPPPPPSSPTPTPPAPSPAAATPPPALPPAGSLPSSGSPSIPPLATDATPTEAPVAAGPPGPGPEASAALAALQALQASVVKGPTYRDYAMRVSESRAAVETFLQNPVAHDGGLKAVMNAGIKLYALAMDAWGVRLRKSGYEALAADPAADLCPALRDKMRGARDQGLLRPTPQGQGIGVAAGLPQILVCAGERVDEAARMMAPPTK